MGALLVAHTAPVQTPGCRGFGLHLGSRVAETDLAQFVCGTTEAPVNHIIAGSLSAAGQTGGTNSWQA